LSSVGTRKPAWKPGYALIWTNAAAARLVQTVAPHLRVKSGQARALLNFADHLRQCHRTRNRLGQLLPLSPEELRTRRAMYERVKLMNARGPPSGEARPRSRCSRHRRQGPSAKYLAGFLDAEGSIMISRTRGPGYIRPTYRARVAISNTDKAILQDVQRAFVGILANQPPPKAAWKHSYQLVWSEGMVSRLLTSIAPHLQLKREQATVAFRFIHHKARVRRHGGGFAPLSDGTVAFRESLYRRMQALNARGSVFGGSAGR